MMQSSIIVFCFFLDFAFNLCDKRTFQDNPSFLVALTLVCCKFIYPAKLCTTVFARNIANHMSTGEHDAILHLTEAQVDDTVEQKCTACCSGETCWNELHAIRKRCLTVGANEYSCSTKMAEKYTTHDPRMKKLLWIQSSMNLSTTKEINFIRKPELKRQK